MCALCGTPFFHAAKRCYGQELEEEVLALAAGRQQRARLKELMHKKELVGDVFNQVPTPTKTRPQGLRYRYVTAVKRHAQWLTGFPS